MNVQDWNWPLGPGGRWIEVAVMAGATVWPCVCPFSAHLNRRLKWAYLITICPLPVVVVVINFSHFLLLLQNHWTNFNQTWYKPFLGEGDSSSIKGPCPFSRRENDKRVKIYWQNLKIFFSRTTGPISTWLGTKHPWVK